MNVRSTPGEGTEVALLDRSGVIVEVNPAWVDFTLANGGDPATTGVGASYLVACESAAPDPTALLVAAAIRTAVAGDLPQPVRVVVPCDSPDNHRWYEVLVSSRHALARDASEGGASEGNTPGTCIGAAVCLRRVPDPRTASTVPSTVLSQAEPDTGVFQGAWGTAAATAVLEKSPDGLVVVDDVGRIAVVNQQVEVLTGYRRADLIGESVEVLVPEAVREEHRRWRQPFAASARERPMDAGLELSLLRKDGTELPVEIALAPVEVAGRRWTAATIRDVTRRQAADRHRRWLMRMLDLVPDVVLVVDGRSLRVEYANQAAADLLGHSPDRLRGLPCAELIPALEGLDAPALRDAIRSAPGGAAVWPCLLRTADGQEAPGESHISSFDPEEGETDRPAFLMVVRDVRERQAQERRLRLSEESFRAAFEQAPIGMAVTRVDGRGRRVIVRANQALTDMLGQPDQTLVGTDFGDFAHPDDVGTTEDEAAAAQIAAGRRRVYSRRKRYRRRDGSTIWVDLRSSRVEFPDEPGVTTLAHLVDVTDRRNIERQRALDQEKLAVLEDRQRIARDLHDTVIQDAIALGMHLHRRVTKAADPVERERQADLVAVTETLVRRLRGVVFQLGDRPTGESLTATIQAMTGEAARVLGHEPRVVIRGAVDDVSSRHCDHISAVLREALSNIARHAHATMTTVGVDVDGCRLRLTVEDDGRGLPGSITPGNGILNMRHRATALAGDVCLTSRPEGGTRLTWSCTLERPGDLVLP